jgi:Ca2+-binding RTX toxin-like protein
MLESNYNYLQQSASVAPPYISFTNSSINNQGDVAFEAFLAPDLPPLSIFSANSLSSTNIIDNGQIFLSGGAFQPVFDPSINNSGTVSFINNETSQLTDQNGNIILDENNEPIIQLEKSSIKIGNGGEPVTLLESNVPYETFGGAEINDRGTVVYVAGNLLNIPVDFPVASQVYTINEAGVITEIASTDGIFSSFDVGIDTIGGDGPITALDISPSINEDNQVAFNAGLDTGGQGVFVYDGVTINEIVNNDGEFEQFSSPDINDEGAIAFLAQKDDGSRGIYTNTYGQLNVLVDDSSEFSLFNSQPAFNNNGEVAFYGELDDGSAGIFVASETGYEQIVAVGDELAGSTVSELVIVQEGINDSGQVAFQARLADGNFAIFRADPISQPTQDNDRLYGDTNNNQINGLAGNDLIVGNQGDDKLVGSEGNDLLRGGQGCDILEGGTGYDTLVGGDDQDIFKLTSGNNSDQILDYVDGIDKFTFDCDWQFSQIEISQNGDNTDIKLLSTGDLLASVSGVDAQAIEATDFV